MFYFTVKKWRKVLFCLVYYFIHIKQLKHVWLFCYTTISISHMCHISWHFWRLRWGSHVNVKCRIVDVSSIILASSDRRRTKLPLFDSSQWGGSNESCFILLRPLDAEIFNETRFYLFLISTCRNYFGISTNQESNVELSK